MFLFFYPTFFIVWELQLCLASHRYDDNHGIMSLNLSLHYHKITIRYGVVANISRSHNLRDQFRGAQGSIPCTGECLLFLFAFIYDGSIGGTSWD
jgi:hypothetical protein